MINTITNLGSVADTQRSEDQNTATYTSQILDSYPEYDLQAEQIVRNGQPTNFQLIVKDNQPVASFTKGYKVIPNETVAELVDEIAERHGLIRASQMNRDWQYHLSMPDTFYGYKYGVETAMTSVLIDPNEIDLNKNTGAESDFLRFGVAIGNSIDGTQSLRAVGFSFRKVCGNMAMHFKSNAMMTLNNAEQIANVGNISTATIAKTSFVHKRSLNIDKFSDAVSRVLDYSGEFFEQLQKMRQQKIRKDQALKIAKAMPKTVCDRLDWLSIDKLGNVNLRTEPTQYNAWNDLTDILSHDKKLGYNGKLRYFNSVDTILVQ